MKELNCEFPDCINRATLHRVEVDGWTLVAKNYCSKHDPKGTFDGKVVPLVAIGLFATVGLVVQFIAIDRGDPALAYVVPVFFAALLAVMAWWFFPEAKAFVWLRRRAAVRLLRRASWAEVQRSAPALIIPLGRSALPELRARFRREIRSRHYIDEAIAGVMDLLDRVAPGWLASEVRFLVDVLVEELGLEYDYFCRVLKLLERADSNWLASAQGDSGRLIRVLMSSLARYHTDRSSTDKFTVEAYSGGYSDSSVSQVTATPSLNATEHQLFEQVMARLRLLQEVLRLHGSRLDGTMMVKLASWPDLGLHGVLGRYHYVSGADDRDNRYEKDEYEWGLKEIINCTDLRDLAKRRLAESKPSC